MASFFLSFLLLVLLSCPYLSVSATPSGLDEVCHQVSFNGWDDSDVSEQLCRSVISTDPRSRTADRDGICIIAANIAAKKATLAAARMKQVVKVIHSPAQRKALQACVQEYTNAIPALNRIPDLIKRKKYSDALDVVDGPLGVPQRCEVETAHYPAIYSIFVKLDTEFMHAVEVAYQVADYLTQHYYKR